MRHPPRRQLGLGAAVHNAAALHHQDGVAGGQVLPLVRDQQPGSACRAWRALQGYAERCGLCQRRPWDSFAASTYVANKKVLR